VDEAGLGLGVAFGLGRLTRLVHQGVGVVARVAVGHTDGGHQRQRDLHQGAHRGCGRAGSEQAHQGGAQPGLAQGMEGDGLHAGAQGGRHGGQQLGQGAAGLHPSQALRRVLDLLGQAGAGRQGGVDIHGKATRGSSGKKPNTRASTTVGNWAVAALKASTWSL